MNPVEPNPVPGTLSEPRVFGLNQPQYSPLPARVTPGGGHVITEWEIDEDELASIAASPDDHFDIRVRVHCLTHGRPLQPLRVEFLIVPREHPVNGVLAPPDPPEVDVHE